jgi:Erv1 / Alr family
MDTTVWGPFMWKTIHHIALSYPSPPAPEERRAYRAFFENLHEVIPCKVCAANYRQHLKELPVSEFLVDAFSLFSWTVHMHNLVNKMNGKAEWSVSGAYDEYTRSRQPNKKKKFEYAPMLLLLLACVIVFVILVYSGCIMYARHNILYQTCMHA